jgi:type II secretory pathway component PulF
MLMSLSASMVEYWWAYILALSGTLVVLKLFRQSEVGKSFFDKVAVSGPLVASLSNKINTCRLLRTLGSMLESKVSMVEALEVTRATIPNRYHQNFIDQIIGHVQGGGKFSQPFAAYPYTMESVKKMVATGEEAGNLPKVMLRLAEFYDTEAERELKHVGTLIEPLALILMGGVVGFIVSSIVLPLFRLASTLN